ncbi:DedA family protein [Rhodobacteraceae bacterium N5(2021)]|uniref:DedA family protein n=1 Tax=Gymnodinialimonas phycosphaerae TaxID=2841589 RepID=A0A975TX18_9RHOB|nr:DedA family protein [Gymnodinialimonas phycosphaerae]MBY4892536.1 DedA family protein [Gymnodinialimonas phycosphaerae]
MTETVLSLVSAYGALIVAICAFLSCLLVPIPTSLVMLSAGAFVAAGDLTFAAIWMAAWGAAVLGDNTGFLIGRTGGARVIARLARAPSRAKVIARAEASLAGYDGLGVFFSTWLFAPLGPYVNFVAGSIRMPWARYAVFDMAGEAIWVSFYLGLGYAFGDHIDDLSMLLGNASGFLVAGLITVALGFALIGRIKPAK